MIDLRTILTPIVEQVADLVFPDLVTIEEPVRVQDATGDPTTTWDDLATSVPALIAPVSSNDSRAFSPVVVEQTDVTILLAGDRDVLPQHRIRVQYTPAADFGDPGVRAGDRWDVMGVLRDEARVTTTILGRRRKPGTPEEGS